MMWGIHPGQPRSPFLDGDEVNLVRAGIGDLRAVGDDQIAVKTVLSASYPGAPAGRIAVWASVLRRFAFGPAIGDLFAHPEPASRTVSLGRFSGAYDFRAPDVHARRVTWVRRRVPRDHLPPVARQALSARQAFFEFEDEDGQIERILSGA